MQKLADRIDPRAGKLRGAKRLKLKKLDMSRNKIRAVDKAPQRMDISVLSVMSNFCSAYDLTKLREHVANLSYRKATCPLRRFVDMIGSKVLLASLDLSGNMQIEDPFGHFLLRHMKAFWPPIIFYA